MTDPRDRLLEDMAKALHHAVEWMHMRKKQFPMVGAEKALLSYKAWKEGKKQ